MSWGRRPQSAPLSYTAAVPGLLTGCCGNRELLYEMMERLLVRLDHTVCWTRLPLVLNVRWALAMTTSEQSSLSHMSSGLMPALWSLPVPAHQQVGCYQG